MPTTAMHPNNRPAVALAALPPGVHRHVTPDDDDTPQQRHAGPQPIDGYAMEGSPQRLAVMTHLGANPAGEGIGQLALVAGLTVPQTRELLRRLRHDQGRVACEQRGKDSVWFSPAAREAHRARQQAGASHCAGVPA